MDQDTFNIIRPKEEVGSPILNSEIFPMPPFCLRRYLPMTSNRARMQKIFLWSITSLMQCVTRWFHLSLICFISNDQQDTKELLEAECDEHRDLRIKSARLRQDFATVQQDNAALRYYYSRLHKDLSTQLQNVQDARRQDEAARCEEEERVMRVVLDWETRSRIAQGEFLLCEAVSCNWNLPICYCPSRIEWPVGFWW